MINGGNIKKLIMIMMIKKIYVTIYQETFIDDEIIRDILHKK